MINFEFSRNIPHNTRTMSDAPTTDAVPEVELAKLAIADTNGAATASTATPAATPATPEPSASNVGDFKESFKAFSKFGDSKSDGKHITLSQSDKWMKQAKVIDKKITTTDTAIHFKKHKAIKLAIGEYTKFLEELAAAKKIEVAEIKTKLSSCGAPGVAQLNVILANLIFIFLLLIMSFVLFIPWYM